MSGEIDKHKYLDSIDAAFNFLQSRTDEELFNQFKFKGKVLENYKNKLNYFDSTNGNNNISTKEKGEALENLVNFIANQTSLFEIYLNEFTSTNELDLLLHISTIGMRIMEHRLDFGKDIICECKNYKDKVGVTWIGKFHSLLKCHHSSFGIIFSYHGFTGENWKDATGMAKKIYLADKTIIIDFNFNDFEKLLESDFFTILKEKVINLRNDTKIELGEHPAEKFLE